MTTRIPITSSFFVIAMLLACPMASAEVTGACLKDVKAQCAGVQPGGGRIKDCLKMHLKDLSEDCQSKVLKAVKAKACAADVKQFCKDSGSGEGKIEARMKAHVANVSDACKVALAHAAAGED